jgi:hypothetical protein
MPTDVAVAADLAQAVALPQRWWARAGHFADDLAPRWLIAPHGFPSACVDAFRTGGSIADRIGLGAARQHAGGRLDLHPEVHGRQLRGCTTYRWLGNDRLKGRCTRGLEQAAS